MNIQGIAHHAVGVNNIRMHYVEAVSNALLEFLEGWNG
jgi:hypothetical protein